MRSIKNYNNNVILGNDNGKEVIVLGKGVGFGLKPGTEVDPSRVEKVFVLQENAGIQKFKDILPDLPYEHLLLASRIVDHGRERLKTPLNQSIIIALADHISFVIKRLADHLEIQTPLAWDIRHIYPGEYAVGVEALEIMRRETGITFPADEAAAVALHFINAALDTPDMPNTMQAARIIQDCVSLAETHCGVTFDKTGADFIGFVTMLRNAVMGFLRPGSGPKAPEDEKLYLLLKREYGFDFLGAEKIAEALSRDHGWELSRNDVCFLTLFLSRLRAE